MKFRLVNQRRQTSHQSNKWIATREILQSSCRHGGERRKDNDGLRQDIAFQLELHMDSLPIFVRRFNDTTHQQSWQTTGQPPPGLIPNHTSHQESLKAFSEAFSKLSSIS